MTRDRTRAFPILYAVASAGSVIAYSPFLVLVLPGRVTALTGSGDVYWFGLIMLAGSIAASIGGVVAGIASDRLRRRRAWVAGGLVVTLALLPVMGRIDGIVPLLIAVAVWQVALNAVLIPLAAWAADRVPPDRTGRLGGWLAWAPVVGAWSGLLLADLDGRVVDRLWLIALVAAGLIVPVLTATDRVAAQPSEDAAPRPPVAVARRMWIARLLVQVAAGGPSSYLLFWMRSVDPGIGGARVTILFALGLTLSAIVAMVLGRWIDRRGRALPILAGTALGAGVGLAAMAGGGGTVVAAAAYLLFATASAGFLGLHSGQTLRVLPDPRHHGRDIGLFNLTNTCPALIVPLLAIGVIPRIGYGGLFLLSTGLCIAAAGVLMSVSRLDRRAASTR